MSDTSEESDTNVSSISYSDVSSISDDDTVMQSIVAQSENDYPHVHPPDDLSDVEKYYSKYRDYKRLKSFNYIFNSETRFYSPNIQENSSAFLEAVNRIYQVYKTPFIYISGTLLSHLGIPQQMKVPSSILCDVFIVAPRRSVGLFTFLSESKDEYFDDIQEYNSYISRKITSFIRSYGIANFSMTHGIIDVDSNKDDKTFSDKIKLLEQKAYLIGLKSSMNLDASTCESVIQIFLRLLFEETSFATEGLKSACRDGKLQLVNNIISLSSDTVSIPYENGETPLMWASFGGQYEVVNRLLFHNPDVNVTNNRGETALILACRKSLLHETLARESNRKISFWGCILAHDIRRIVEKTSILNVYNIVKLLLDNKAELNAVDCDGFTPLILMCIFGDIKTTKLLLSRGVNVNNKGIFDAPALFWACLFGHEIIVQELIKIGAHVNERTQLNISALWLSCYFGYDRIAETLLSGGANVHDADKFTRRTPLFYASFFGYPKLARLLISQGAQINISDINDDTPLMAATACGHTEITELLISKKADANHQGTHKMTSLMCSAAVGHTETVVLLLPHISDIDKRDENRKNALMWACLGGWDKIVRKLLEHGADANSVDCNGNTPLSFVCRHLRNIFEHLYEEKDKNVYACFIANKLRPQALELAMTKNKHCCSDTRSRFMQGYAHLTGNQELLSSLMRVFSDQPIDTRTMTLDNDDEMRHDRVLRLLLQYRNSNDMQRLKLNSTDDTGNSALLVACIVGYQSGARMLLEHNVDVGIRNVDGDTALSVASREGHTKLVQMLLDHKADVNERGSAGDSPLIKASREGHYTVVQVLLTHSADICLLNDYGKTALSVAEEGGHDTVFDILQKHQTETVTVSSELQDHDKKTASPHPTDWSAAGEMNTDLGGRNISVQNNGVYVGSNMVDIQIQKCDKKKHQPDQKKSFKQKAVIKAEEMLKQCHCKVS